MKEKSNPRFLPCVRVGAGHRESLNESRLLAGIGSSEGICDRAISAAAACITKSPFHAASSGRASATDPELFAVSALATMDYAVNSAMRSNGPVLGAPDREAGPWFRALRVQLL